jgi:hypothetical protein
VPPPTAANACDRLCVSAPITIIYHRPFITPLKRTAGGHALVGAGARLLSSHAGDPRAATGDTTLASQTQPGRHAARESARRRPENQPNRSDITPDDHDDDTEAAG